MLLGVSSCGASGEAKDAESAPPSRGQWAEPAWMIESKKTNEELSSKITSCMADRGWTETRERDGSFSISLSAESDGPRYQADRIFCDSTVREDMDITPVARDDDFFRTMYSRTLDTRDCLVAHGVAVSEPPSEDAWIEALKSGSAGVWAPFNDVTGSDDEFYELFDVCVQGGVEVTR